MQRAIEIHSGNGVMDALLFTPAAAGAALPAVLLFTDIGGLRDCYYEKAQIVADAGYAVLMPNIYYRDAAGEVLPKGVNYRDPEYRPTLLQYAARLTPAAQAQDFAVLLACIDAQPEFRPGALAVVGYCLTGAFALRMAALHPDRVRAAAAFHAAWPADRDAAEDLLKSLGSIRAQVYLGHADKDGFMPPAQIARLDGALAEASVHFTTELYAGALHGYTAKDAPSFDEAAAARHYRRLFSLLKETLG